jgi:hypothetical protein
MIYQPTTSNPEQAALEATYAIRTQIHSAADFDQYAAARLSVYEVLWAFFARERARQIHEADVQNEFMARLDDMHDEQCDITDPDRAYEWQEMIFLALREKQRQTWGAQNPRYKIHDAELINFYARRYGFDS